MSARALVAVAATTTAVLVGAAGSAAKEFGPGDLRVCDATRCVPITKPGPVQGLSAFYYTGRQPSAISRPSWGAPAFELRFSNGYVTGVVGGRSLDRFLSFGVFLERFRRGTWYRLPPGASTELRRLAASLEPYRVTPAMLRRSR